MYVLTQVSEPTWLLDRPGLAALIEKVHCTSPSFSACTSYPAGSRAAKNRITSAALATPSRDRGSRPAYAALPSAVLYAYWKLSIFQSPFLSWISVTLYCVV